MNNDNGFQQNSDQEESKYPFAEWMLGEIKEQYAIENERENKINTKAGAFITVIVAVIALYIPLIPFDRLKVFMQLASTSDVERSITVLFLVILGLGMMILMMAFYYFLRAYGIKGYQRVQVDDLLSLANETGEKNNYSRDQVAQGLTAHYHKILRGTLDMDGNMKINTNSADSVLYGIIWTVVGFIIVSIATIALRIIVI